MLPLAVLHQLARHSLLALLLRWLRLSLSGVLLAHECLQQWAVGFQKFHAGDEIRGDFRNHAEIIGDFFRLDIAHFIFHAGRSVCLVRKGQALQALRHLEIAALLPRFLAKLCLYEPCGVLQVFNGLDDDGFVLSRAASLGALNELLGCIRIAVLRGTYIIEEVLLRLFFFRLGLDSLEIDFRVALRSAVPFAVLGHSWFCFCAGEASALVRLVKNLIWLCGCRCHAGALERKRR